MAFIPATMNPECYEPKADRPLVSIEFEREPRRWWWPFGRGRLRARFFVQRRTDTGYLLKEETIYLRPDQWFSFAIAASANRGREELDAIAARIADQWWWPIVRLTDIAEFRLKRGVAAERLRDRAESDLKDAGLEIAELRGRLAIAKRGVKECIAQGYVATSLNSADGVTIERGDNAFLGSDPERRLILIDCREAIEALSLKVIGLPDGVPVFSRRDLARAWKRAQETPTAPPAPSDAGAAPAVRHADASVGGTADGTGAGALAADVPLFGGAGS